MIWPVRSYAVLNTHVCQNMFRLHQSNLITHDLVCASSQCHVFGSIVLALMHGPRKRVLLRWMGEDAQCCKWVTHVSHLLRLAPSPRRAEKAAPRDSSGRKCLVMPRRPQLERLARRRQTRFIWLPMDPHVGVASSVRKFPFRVPQRHG